MIKSLLRPIYGFYKKKREIFLFKRHLNTHKDNIKIVVGSSGFYESGWIPTESSFLNLLEESDWSKYFRKSSISNILAEHVWEHLSANDGFLAAQTCHTFLKTGGRIRIAVPDGFHSDEQYINYVKPGGTGAGADDHKILYTYQSMTEMLIQAGFEVLLLEYFDENGVFHRNAWERNEGFVHRSFEFDKRNANGRPNYTSLIVDAIKQ